ncbi:MAG TPA: ferritin-like protein [Pyrinomonadaceae bacterium]|nr:ferritin-like protein [Pyrinomonadaceae bacterium]
MIKLRPEIISGIRSAATADELGVYLQNAIMLEHSTIPPYLTAMFSLRTGTNAQIARQIHEIVIEEMLHMAIAANILIAIGGYPAINVPDFVPKYPGPLPMNIGDLQVGIEAFSIDLVKNTFMAIEEPEHPIPIKTVELETVQYATIGQFYDAIKDQIQELGPSIFVKPYAPPQVVSPKWFGDRLFVITDPYTACKAIDLIKLEGEGTSESPFASPGDPAHFYRFGEIAAGRRIIKTPDGFAYGGAPILFEPSGVWPLRANCKIADFADGTHARTRIEAFAYNYSALLNSLHNAFNGDPALLDTAIGVMYDLRTSAVALMETDTGDSSGQTVGPSFEYVDVQGGMPN